MPFLRDVKANIDSIGIGNLLKIATLIIFVCFLIFYPWTAQETPQKKSPGVKYEYVKEVLARYSDGLHSYSYGICGYSVESKPIYYYSIGEGEETILILGGLHGNEPKGTYACLELLQNLTESGDLLARYRFIVIPLCNPDGAERFRRFNSENVDLNRDFYKFSQPETRAIREIFIENNPVLLIDVHESLSGQPVIIYANNTKSRLLASFFNSETRIFMVLAADVGQSANFAEKNGIHGVIVELPFFSWEYRNGTIIVWQFIKSWDKYRKEIIETEESSRNSHLNPEFNESFMNMSYHKIMAVKERHGRKTW